VAFRFYLDSEASSRPSYDEELVITVNVIKLQIGNLPGRCSRSTPGRLSSFFVT